MDISKLRKKAREQQPGIEQPKEHVKSVELSEEQKIHAEKKEEIKPVEKDTDNRPAISDKPVDRSMETLQNIPEQINKQAQEPPLAELTREALKKYPQDTKEKELLCFKLENEEYAIELNNVKEIIRVKDITPVPNTAEFVLGITVLRGDIVPVIDLRRRIGLPPLAFTSNTRFIIVSFEGATAAIVVDNVPDVKRVAVESIKSADRVGSVDIRFLSGISTGNGGFTILLKLEEILKQSDMLKV